ncbi:MAG: ECF-type sigma factor [Terracidiphilus sp.]
MTIRGPAQDTVTRLLIEMRNGNSDAINRLYPIVFGELRRVAASLMRRERPGHTLQPTALVNEAFIRLAAGPDLNLQDRAHFLAVAARAMRQALVEHARSKFAKKRGGNQVQVEIETGSASFKMDLEQIIAVDQALDRLEELDAVQAKIIEMQYFIGNSIEEIAAATGLPERTAKRELQTGRLFLAEQLQSRGLKLG